MVTLTNTFAGESSSEQTKKEQQPGGFWSPLKIIIIYVLVSGAWILLSDRLVNILVEDPPLASRIQTFKGWGFVLVTAWLLYGLIQRYTRSLQQAQDALREREAWYRRIIMTAEEGIWVLDTRHYVTFANQRLANMLDYTIPEILGRSVFDLIDPSWRGEFAHHLEARAKGAHEVFETRLLRKDGKECWVNASATPIMDESNQFQGSFAMLTDITERRQREEFRREFARKTIEAATEGKLLIRTREEIAKMAGPPIMTLLISHIDDLINVRHSVAEVVRAAGMDEERIFDLLVSLCEAATNAIKHAEGGALSLHRMDDTMLVVITDQGPGILAINLPEVALKPGYTTASSLGLGYKAMISMADHVYLATDPRGTTVAIAMGLHKQEQPPLTIPEEAVKW